MLNGLLEMATGTDNKSGGKIKLSMKCSGIKLDYEYNGPKLFSEGAEVTEKRAFELDEFEIEGECEATMSGIFKLMGEIKDAMTSSAAPEKNKDCSLNIAAFDKELGGEKVCISTINGYIDYKVKPLSCLPTFVTDRAMRESYAGGKAIIIIKSDNTCYTKEIINIFCHHKRAIGDVHNAVSLGTATDEIESRIFNQYCEEVDGYKYIIMGIK